MKLIHLRPSAFCYGLCFALAAAGCLDSGDLDNSEAVASSAITLDGNSTYAMVGVQSSKCVGPVGGSAASGARLEIETCTGTANQRFRPEAMAGGFFRLRNELSGLCVDVSGVSLADGAAIIQFACSTGLNQQWSVTDVAGGAERLTARHSGKVLDVTGQVVTDGTLLEQWSSNNGTNQQFRMNQALPAFGP